MRTCTIRNLLSAAMLAASVATLSPAAIAAVPGTITHQGRLYDSSNSPVNGTLSVQFSLYDTPTATVPIWTEVHQVTFDQGYYSAALGSIVPFGPTVFDGSPRDFGLTVGTDAEMTPRATVASVPYAMLASDVNGDIHPTSVSIGGNPVINAAGQWVGSPAGLQGPAGVAGPAGAAGPQGANGADGAVGMTGPQGADGAASNRTAGSAATDYGSLGAMYDNGTETTTVFLAVSDNTSDSVYIGGGALSGATSWRGLRVYGNGSAQLSGGLSTNVGSVGFGDVAESIPTASGFTAGEVVSINAEASGKYDNTVFVRSSRPYDPAVAGVISEHPSVTVGNMPNPAPLALNGVVHIKVTAEGGAIRPGDLLTTSSTQAHAMKATNPPPGTVVGKAVEALTPGTKQGSILMLVLPR